MTLYRFQKEGATNPRKVAEAQTAPADAGAGNQSLPLSPSRPKPGPGGQTLTFNDVSWNDSVFDSIAISGNDRVLIRQTESTQFSTDASESAVSTHASGTHYDLSQKLSETNPIPDLSDPSVERETVRTDGRERDKSRRRETGAATPSENPQPTSARAEPSPVGAEPVQPDMETSAAPGPTAAGATERAPSSPIEATRITGQEEKARPSETVQATGPRSEPGGEHTPSAQSGPRVSIGQLEVMVVKTPRSERPTKATSSRHFLSRNYLRRL